MLALRTILVATDYSDGAAAARRLAEALAERHGAALHVLHVATTHGAGRPRAEVEQDERPEPPRREGPRTEVVERRAYAAAPAILRYLDEVDADLVVLGTHGWRGLRRGLGGVAGEVLRRAPCPVLTVRSGWSETQIRHVLAPVDFSEHAQRALCYAEELAAAFDARLTVLHVVEEVSLPGIYGAVTEPVATDEVRERARLALLRMAEHAPAPTGELAVEVRAGTAAAEVAAFAAEAGVDLIVMASHGRTGLERFRLGSVAEHVAREATCPVFTVKSFGKPLIAPEHTYTPEEWLAPGTLLTDDVPS